MFKIRRWKTKKIVTILFKRLIEVTHVHVFFHRRISTVTRLCFSMRVNNVRLNIYIYIYAHMYTESQNFLRFAATNPKPHDSYEQGYIYVHAHRKVGRDARARHESHLSFSEKQITNKYQHVRDDTRGLIMNRDTENRRFVARREPNRPVERIRVCTAF